MRRVVVTGMGIVSSIGNTTQEVLASLREARSGITRADKYTELGFRSQVHGAPSLDPSESVDRRAMRFHGGGTAWNHVAMDQAIRDSGLEPSDLAACKATYERLRPSTAQQVLRFHRMQQTAAPASAA